MSRAKWKGPYIKKKSLLNAVDKKKSREFLKLRVSEEMIGHKFGELVFTRKFFSYKKK